MVYDNDSCQKCGAGRLHFSGQRALLNRHGRERIGGAFVGYVCDHCGFILPDENKRFTIEAIFRDPKRIQQQQ